MDDGPSNDAFDLERASSKEFSRARKGVDASEVQAHVLTLVEEIRRLRRAETDLSKNVRSLEAELEAQERPDASAMTKLLGEETARVLDAAREASEEIRSKSEENASRLVREAHDRASRLADEATAMHEQATRDSDELLASARTAADDLLADARERSQKLAADAEEKAAETLDRADRILSEKTAEAEAAAERLRGEAEQIRADAQKESEELSARAEKQSAEVRERATAEAAEQITRAEVESDRILEEAIAESGEARRAAEEDAVARVETAREQGRTMVSEAREARERMLRDLAERRKLARQQLEALRAGRERMLESFTAARNAFDTASGELVDAVPNARTAADGAARSVDEDIDAAVAELDLEIGGRLELDEDLAEMDAAPFAPASDPEDDGPGTDALHSVGAETRPDDDSVEPTDEIDDGDDGDDLDDDRGDADPESSGDGPAASSSGDAADDGPVDASDGSSGHLRLVAANEGDEVEAARSSHGDGEREVDIDIDLDLDEDIDDDDDLDDEDEGDVEMLFARLRAERESRGDTSDSGVGGAADNGAESSRPFTGRDAVVIDLNASDGIRDGDPEVADADAELDSSTVVTREDDPQEVLDRRDALIDPVAKDVNRRLKRWVSDLENALMDRIRRQKKSRDSATLLDEQAALVATCAEALEVDLARAVNAGGEFAGSFGLPADDVDPAAEVEAVIAVLSDQLVGPLVTRLEHVIDGTDDDSTDGSELVGRVRAVHREWRGERLTEVADDLAHLAFNRGVLAARPPGGSSCWVVDFGGLPCPDAEDNQLAGAVTAGESFPTGHVCPPAHPGCRCVLLPRPSDS